MIVNAEVVKGNNENNLAVLRRFTKRVQGSGVLSKLRSTRFSERAPSEYTKKKMALKRIKRQSEVAEAVKMGKAPAKK